MFLGWNEELKELFNKLILRVVFNVFCFICLVSILGLYISGSLFYDEREEFSKYFIK